MRVLLALLVGFTATCAAPQKSSQSRALEVLELSGFREAVRAADSAYVSQVLKSAPEWQPYADILEEWSHSVYNWQAWQPVIVKHLSTTFSESELDSLAAFYRSPAGRKWAAMRGPLQAYLTKLSVEAQAELGPALMEKLRARAAQLHKPLPPMRS